ncbi:hypothetical protein HIM_06525 [Hirsutella minnesotensis 3608]|uniref:Uncharacterized protein n=1 Tax=Hirsutella minnesotensis 3608 TaxID=1043627 RepID=A0A0F7ZIZ5_9HYPO|nr:hypothetical protein HIM_06525 [Hirsutella minnesotensis 3608]
MEGVRRDDPFLWDAEAVVQSLCSLSRPCTRDPDQLATRIREEGIDGHTLLSFEFVCSRPELFECLGIKLGVHKASLGRAILSLRSKSPAFRRWKTEFLQEQLEELSDAPENHQNAAEGPSIRPTATEPAASESPANTAEGHQVNGEGRQGPHPNDNDAKIPSRQESQSILDEPPSNNPPAAVDASPHPPAPSVNGNSTEPKGVKRKRVAPLQLASRPINLTPLPLPTQADGLMNGLAHVNAPDHGEFPWERSGPQAYLGNGVVKISAIKDPLHSLSSQIIDKGDAFATKHPVTLPRGLRLTAKRVMTHFMRRQGRKEALLRQGIVPMETSVSDEDEDLNVFDFPDEFDEETLKEIEAEQAEIRQAEALRQASIKPERVHELLQEVIEEFKARWTETKLPKHQLKAYKIWTDARKHGTSTQQAIQAFQRAQNYDNRIHKLRSEILEQIWAKELEVRDQAKCMQQTVEDKLYNVWLSNMLNSRLAPKKPESLSKPRRTAPKRPQSPTGSEILTSSDEDDFIVPDEDEMMKVETLSHVDDDRAKSMQPNLLTPVKPESSSYVDVDLTQVETPESLRCPRQRTVIDLITPVKPKDTLEPPSTDAASVQEPEAGEVPGEEDEFESFEQIGEQQPSHWVKHQDREKLIICLLWKLSHSQRTRVLDAARNNSATSLYPITIGAYLVKPFQSIEESKDDGEQAIAFHITHLFLSYIRLKVIKPSRMLSISPRNKEKLQTNKGDRWAKFHAFLNRIAPHFPQESQIYRTDAYDLDLADLDDGDDTLPNSQATPSRRKPPRKEIVRNKEAVNLREMEARRREEQEARRTKVRAERHTMSMVDRDKSRLIINEAKEDGQSFIYINEEIGKRIQDHQIDGVRFLWDQIMLDREVRQGCLLAHTMGLGKTMQVVTFLVAIQEAAQSTDSTVKEQIPKDLRDSQTLVLCPSSLVENWEDELLIWAPIGLLGPIHKINSDLKPADRKVKVQTWAEEGGVLIVGYSMLKQVVNLDEETNDLLTATPSIVVADEVHTIKNPQAEVHRVCSRFKTNCRIALTGTPLANNVEEYYYMVDWVAPNFLGPIDEFRQIYATPIHQGLWGDSEPWEKRKAIKMLQVLKDTVAPKVDRKTIKSLPKHVLPLKFEFVLCVAPTALQCRLYDICISGLGNVGEDIRSNQTVWSAVENLTLLCNHPRCFREKAMQVRGNQGEGGKGFLSDKVISSALKETNGLDLNNPNLSPKTEMLSRILDEAHKVGDKVLVFTHSIATLNYLDNLLKMQRRRFCRLEGKTDTTKRQEMTKNFNVGEREIFLISTKAGGVGLNLQGANRVVIFDFKWNPIHEQQAIGRAYRIGQKKPVFVYQFIVAGTFEEDMQNKAVFKMQLASRVVDKKNPVSWSKRLGTLLHPIKPAKAKDLTAFTGKDRILDKLIENNAKPKGIQYIVSTDTFEEEDPTSNLSAEDRRHAEQLVKINHLRLTNPSEYERLKQREEEQWRVLQAMPPVQAFGLPQQGPPVSWANTVTQEKPDASSLPLGLDGVQEAPMSSLPASVAQQDLLVLGKRPDSQQSSHGQPPQTVSQPNLTAPLPLPGANTYFGSAPVPEKASVPKPERLPVVPATPPLSFPFSGAKIFNTPRGSPAKERFEQRLCDRFENLRSVIFSSPDECKSRAQTITKCIYDEQMRQANGFLHDDQRWRFLNEQLEHDRFVLAVASGHLPPKYLALASNKDFEERLSLLKSLAARDFERRIEVPGGKLDPQV